MPKKFTPYSETHPEETRGYVYAVLYESDDPLVKIGVSAKPKNRFMGLQSQSPVPLRLLGAVGGGRRLEHGLHRVLSEYRSHGEWFRYQDDVVRAVDLIVQGDKLEAESFVICRWPRPDTHEDRLAYIASDDFDAGHENFLPRKYG